MDGRLVGEAGAATASGTAGAVGITIKSHLYIWWADIAIERKSAAFQARDHADPSQSLGLETRCGMSAVCAAAFSVEALIIELGQIVLPKALHDAWYVTSRRPPKVESRLRETLKRAVTLPARDVEQLVSDFQSVIEARGRAVHFYGEFAAPVAHPTGTNTSAEDVLFSANAAENAVAVMCNVLRAVRDHPKPEARKFADDHRTNLPPGEGPQGT